MIDNNNQKPNASFDIDDLPKPYEAGAGCFAWSVIITALFGIGLICGLTWIGFVIYGWFNN